MTHPTRTEEERRRREIADEVERLLDEAGRRVELRVAYARALAFSGLGLAVGSFKIFAPDDQAPSSTILVATIGAVLSIALVIILRRGLYSPAIPIITLVLEGAYAMGLFVTLRARFGAEGMIERGIGVSFAVGCALIIAMAGLRLRRSAVVAATLIIVPIFVFVVDALGSLQTVTVATPILLAVAVVSLWMTEMVRSAIAGEVARRVLERFLPRQVVAGAHQDPVTLLSRPRACEVTALVSDLRGFTALAEKLPAEETLALLNEIQGRFAGVVEERGGVVDKFMGDGMLAIFGAPEPVDDHAARGLQAAAALVDAMAQINAAWAEVGRAAVKVGVGVHSGLVVSGCLGSGARLEFTVVGDTVNIASRLEALTKEKGVSVLVSATTAERAAPHLGALGAGVSLSQLGEVHLRGRSEPLAILALDVPSTPRAGETADKESVR